MTVGLRYIPFSWLRATTPFHRPQASPAVALLTGLYLRMILIEFRWSVILLAGALCLGAIVISHATDAAGHHIPIPIAIYDAWMSLLVQPYLDPLHWYVGAIHMLYPILGFTIIGEGIVRLALLVVSKRQGEKEWMRVLASTYRDHVILCGLGHLGIRVLQQLLAQGMDVVVLEQNENGKFVSQGKALGVPIIHHDMKDDEALIQAGIKHARRRDLHERRHGESRDGAGRKTHEREGARGHATLRAGDRRQDFRRAGNRRGLLRIDARRPDGRRHYARIEGHGATLDRRRALCGN